MISARVPSWRIRQCSACSWMALDSRNRSPSLPPNGNIRGCSVLSPGVVCMDSEVGGPPKDVSEGSKPAHHRRGCARVIPDPRRVALGRLDYSWHSATHLEEPRSGLASQPNCSCSLYFMFSVPAWCSAMTRQNMLCRNNAYGLLMGCHLREHRWQKLKMAIVPRAWRALMARVWRQNRAQSVGLLLTAVASMAAAAQAVAAVLWRK